MGPLGHMVVSDDLGTFALTLSAEYRLEASVLQFFMELQKCERFVNRHVFPYDYNCRNKFCHTQINNIVL